MIRASKWVKDCKEPVMQKQIVDHLNVVACKGNWEGKII